MRAAAGAGADRGNIVRGGQPGLPEGSTHASTAAAAGAGAGSLTQLAFSQEGCHDACTRASGNGAACCQRDRSGCTTLRRYLPAADTDGGTGSNLQD